MPSKKGKRSSSSPPTEKEGTNPWLDFPKQLLNIIEKQSTLMNNFSYGGVTKSWRLPSPKQYCNSSGKSPLLPQLATTSDGESAATTTFFNILFRVGVYWWYGREHPRQYYKKYYSFHFKGCSQSVLVVTKHDPSEYQLWDPVTQRSKYLPTWDKDIPFKYVALSSYPFGVNRCWVIIVVTGMSKPAFLFSGLKRGSYEWVKQDSTLSDPYSSNNQLMEFTNVVSFQGKFYALSLQGTLAVVEASGDSDMRITCLGKSRAVPSIFSKHFKEYLLKSNGELLLVLLISRKSIKVVDYIEVYRLEFDRLSWEKLQELGDRTLFMGSNCCISMTSSSVGCRRNCVYFTQEEEDGGWCVFDMDKETISPGGTPLFLQQSFDMERIRTRLILQGYLFVFRCR